MSATGGDEAAPARSVRAVPTRRITRGSLWGILQTRLHVPLGDLRRQFQVESDDVSPIATPDGTYFVGLPADGAAVIGQLWHEGRITFDCAPDLRAMVVRAIVPTRPTRPPMTRTPVARTGAPRRAVARPTAMAPVPESRGTSRPPDVPGAPIYPRAPRPAIDARRQSAFAAVDDFLPAPEVDAFASEVPVAGPVDVVPPPGQSAGPARPRSVRTAQARPAPAGAMPGAGAPVGPTADDPAIGPDGGGGDEGSRRRRRGGIGRAARSK